MPSDLSKCVAYTNRQLLLWEIADPPVKHNMDNSDCVNLIHLTHMVLVNCKEYIRTDFNPMS